MTQFYWAVRPIKMRDYGPATRIEKAATAYKAVCLSFGGPILSPSAYEAKNLGTRVAVIQSDSKRIALLQSTEGWRAIAHRDHQEK